MKNLIALILSSSVLLFVSCGQQIQGNGKVQEKQQNLDHFSSIDLSGMFEVELIEGEEHIEVITDENLHEHIHIAVKEGELIIDSKDKYLISKQILLRIYYQDLNAIDVSGAVSIETKGLLQTNHFSFDVSGACEGTLDLAAEDVDIDISGGGELTLSGEAQRVNIDVSGAGEINAIDFNVDEADLQITGAGEIEISVQNTLNVEVTGAGEVRYAGNPTIKKSITGAGEITQVN